MLKPNNQAPSPKVLVRAILLMIAAVTAASMAGRFESLRPYLPRQLYGTPQPSLDVKMNLLQELVKRQGRVDCIFLGPSMIDQAVIPALIEEAYRQQTGNRITAFNFGISALNPCAVEKLARVLNETFHPGLIVVGVIAGLDQVHVKASENFMSSPWLRHCTGDYSWAGWLIVHSEAYRRTLYLRTWLEKPAYLRELSIYEKKIYPDGGCHPAYQLEPPAQPVKLASDPLWFNKFRSFALSSTHLQAIERLTLLQTQVIIVEPPMHPSLVQLYDPAGCDFDKMIQATQQLVWARQRIFWPTTRLNLIPDYGWWNRLHVNVYGAGHFSRWLAMQISRAVITGQISDPRRWASQRKNNRS